MKNLQCREHLEHLSEIYRITDAWRDLGFEGQPAISCRCPWREDRKPSFSVFDGGRAFKDFSTDEAGDVFTFVMLALGLSFKDAKALIEERTGMRVQAPLPIVRRAPSSKAARELKLPALDAVGSLPTRKAHTLKGSSKSWPFGLTLADGIADPMAAILLVEGGPDYLAVSALIDLADALAIDAPVITQAHRPLRLPGCLHTTTGKPATLYYLNPISL
ncbi:CHC2 zinc finger domain-containing protein [Akkermansiaceae bacterium]|nr:CHC2 zinc finger domain-containing protein [Akkermansiaceae bacterium]